MAVLTETDAVRNWNEGASPHAGLRQPNVARCNRHSNWESKALPGMQRYDRDDVRVGSSTASKGGHQVVWSRHDFTNNIVPEGDAISPTKPPLRLHDQIEIWINGGGAGGEPLQ